MFRPALAKFSLMLYEKSVSINMWFKLNLFFEFSGLALSLFGTFEEFEDETSTKNI